MAWQNNRKFQWNPNPYEAVAPSVVYAKTGGVFAGPDGGWIGSLANNIVSWVIGENANKWHVFKPRPMLNSKGFQRGKTPSYLIKERSFLIK